MLEGYISYLKYKSKEVVTMLEGDDVRTDGRDDEIDNITYEAWYKVRLPFLQNISVGLEDFLFVF